MRPGDATGESHTSDQAPPIPRDAAPIPVPGWESGLPLEADDVFGAVRDATWTPGGKVVKCEGDTLTWIGGVHTVDGDCQVVIKRIPHRARLGGFLRRLFQRSRSERQCLGAARLVAIGVPTSEPLLLLRGTEQGCLYDWLVLKRLPGRDLLELLHEDKLTPAEQRDIARRVGALIRKLHERGIFNRDAKLSNLVRTPEGDIGVIDTVAIRQGRPARDPLPSVERMFAPMLFEAVGTRVLPQRTLLYRCAQAACDEPRKLWRALERRLRLAGDTTPKHDPFNRSE